MTFQNPFDIIRSDAAPVIENREQERLQHWWERLLEEGLARKAVEARQRNLSTVDIETLARTVFDEVSNQAIEDGINLPDAFLTQLIGELSGLGPLLELIARPGVEDIAINLGHIYIYTTLAGWEHVGPAPKGIGDAIRVLIDRAGQRAPTPDFPIADAMLQVMVPVEGGVIRKGVRINYIMPPASPYGDTITLRVSSYRTRVDLESGSLALLCKTRLPPVEQTPFAPLDLPTGNGVLTPEAANYLLAVMVQGGTLIVSGATGSGKTFVSQRILQEMLDFVGRGAIRLFIVEDSNEIVLNGWNGDQENDTGNIIYTVTRPSVQGGPPPVTMYDLIRAALRSRPHGVVIGEARGAEAWELIRAAATGHGHSSFTIHATGAEHVWPRFAQVVQAHPDAQRMTELQIAQGFAEAVTTILHIERHPVYGQVVQEILEVSPIVERSAGRPSISPLFRFNPDQNRLLPTGNRPMRPGFQSPELGLPDEFFKT
jgi:type IV secretory pathway ATPase VirB11/archaellum biosynthesis ATPase